MRTHTHTCTPWLRAGVPYEVSSRSVRIYQPAKTATQSGRAETNYWRLDFDVKDRWENPLMGWASSADTVQALRIRFDSKQAAINFAERQGYDFWVDEPKEGKFRVKNYSENFKYSPTKLRIARTK
ncbi:ETC complex I subunit conserved region-domain-containing protein [Entophlyctis helioformis]|nr:ETC complex I subunit conserved region-domain-containing protein [Entophlyctis helioformis]